MLFFFRLSSSQIMYLVDEGCRMLDLHKEFAGKRSFETLLLTCLELLSKALEMQPRFMELLSASNSDRILTPMHQLLIGINARTGNPDHLLNIAKYVFAHDLNPLLCYLSVHLTNTYTYFLDT